MKYASLSCLLSVFLLMASCSKQPLATSGQQVYDVKRFGAVGDSVTVNTAAIQRAIDACFQNGGGTVLVADGVFSSGALFLKENVHLQVEKGAKLRGVAGLENYPELENTRIAGIEMKWPSAFINAIDTKNVKIFGEGTIDGSGYYWWEHYWTKRDSLSKTELRGIIDWHVPRPRLVLFHNVSESELQSINLINAGFWTVQICYSNAIKITDVNIFNPVLEKGKRAASTDGIDVDSSQDVFIRNCSVSVDDDCIAVKSGRGSDGLRVNIPSENVLIENCFFGTGHGGVSIGTETAGGVKNVLVRNCKSDGNVAPIKFKPRPGRGGVIENITHEGWEIKNAGTVIDYALIDITAEDYIDEWQNIRVPFEKANPVYRNITIRNVNATGSGKAISFLGWPLVHAENVILENIKIQAEKGARFQYIDNLLLKNVKIETPGTPIEFLEIANMTRL
ncbi:glycoside hydrolase family 28 protein [Pontibacter qinzhouensis]|uniref:Glycoside hydrolase family 28 protein n=1 Tax=Pontibacter qinzhouensis TaxID=2603253 RepID=A0A5C8K8A8_9BACT|nr:glycoside hydrolase family 28 protein [Pontibacter qinzhouensis]TXK49349.1 glycoside hydrolase family 28 protein [Pontibacter qinzhouensis]